MKITKNEKEKKILRQLLDDSLVQHQGLHDKLTAISKQLPVLDMDSAVKAAENIDNIFREIKTTDQGIFSVLDEDTVAEYRELIAGRMEIGAVVAAQYQSIIPRLQTRLAGYRAELLKIKQGLHTMNGYADSKQKTGSIINTAN